MEMLKERIRSEGHVLNSDVLKVDSFLNHQVDPALMRAIGAEFARIFAGAGITRVATIESSGIAPALYTAEYMNVPLLIMKKRGSRILDEDLVQCEVRSFTKGNTYQLTASRHYIAPGDRVLVIDDFLARGEALRGLCEIVQAAGAELVGIGCAVEKGFQGGGDKLRAAGVNLHSLAIIESAEPGNIVFREEA